MKKITLTLFCLITAAITYGQGVFINELHYDNSGADTGEFVEIAGPAGTDLTGWSVELYNGSNGSLYNTINLSGTIDDEGSGFGALSFFQAGIQNGAPDGLALIDNTATVIQFLSYEGSFSATAGTANGMMSTDIGVSETSGTPVGESLQLTGTGSMYPDFVWNAPAAESPGSINAGQTFSAPSGIPVVPISASSTMPSEFGTDLINTINGVGLDAFPSLTANHTATAPFDSWVTLAATGTIDYALGGLFDIDGFSFWNQNGGGPGPAGTTGINGVIVSSSTDGTNFTPVPGSPSNFAVVPGTGPEGPEMFSFAAVNATHMRLEVLSNHGDAFTGYAEIVFSGVSLGGAPPIISCPMDVVADSDPNACGAVVVYADAIAIDGDDPVGNPPPTVVQISPDPGVLGSGDEFPVGTTTVTFEATSFLGVTSTCSFDITVLDVEDPVIACQDITVELDVNGMATINADQLIASATDNCGISTIEAGSPPGASGSLTTVFGSNNGGAPGGAVYFDVTVGPNDIDVNGLDVNTFASGTAISVDVYSFVGTYVGNETNAGAWGAAIGTATGTTAGEDNPSVLTLGSAITLSANTTYAMALVMDGANTHEYTNGDGSNQNFSNADLTIDLGSASNAPFTGGIFSPRVWNGTINYTTGGGGIPIGPTVDFTCADVGDVLLEVFVTDDSGNTVSCQATVTVEDNIAPVIVCAGEVTGAPVFINEIHYDNTGADQDEAIEIAGPAGTDLSTYSLVLYNGNGGAQYDNVVLSGTIDDEGNGFGAVNFPITGIQNGAPDGIVLAQNGEVLQFLSYEGSFTAVGGIADGMMSTDIGVSESSGTQIGESLQLTGTGNTSADFVWNAPAASSPGSVNSGQTFTAPTSTAIEVDLDANGMASIDVSDLLISANDACGWTATVDSSGTPTSLETTFAGGNSFNGNMFDLNVLNDVTIDSFDVNIAAGTTDDIEVYFKTGSFVGFETDPGPWTLLDTAVGITSAGDGVPTPLNLSLGQAVSAGETVAFYVTTTLGGTMNYTNGTAVGAVFASDANIEFLEGNGGGYPFAVTFSPRVWNGNIHYTPGGGTSTTLDFDCSNLGLNVIEVTVTDPSGNASTCMASVNVNDVTDPILVCQDVTIELDENGMADIDPEALLATLPGTFEVITISSDNQSMAPGSTDLTVNVTDAAAISFDWDYSTPDGPAFDSFGYLLNGVYTELTDPAGDLNQSGSAGPINVVPGDVFGFRSFSVDGVFGAATTVVSNFMPGFEGQFDPANWTLTLDNSDGDAFFVEIPGGPLSFDACGITVLAVDVTEVSCADIGSPITATVFASDASGNLASCTSEITVVDAMAPEITCPADQTVDPGPNNLFYEVPDYWANGEATATDNCTDPVTITSQDPAAGELLPDGTYTVTITAEDEYGNVASCTFELTVESILGLDDNVLDSAIAIYPNPAQNIVTLANSSNIALEAANLYDINGKLIQSVDLSDMIQEKTIDVANLASGVYVVHILGEKASTVKRLIKE